MTHMRALDQNRAEWSASSLEGVDSCPLCGSPDRQVEIENLTDSVYGCAPGTWRFLRCAVCRSAYLCPRPTMDSIALAYETYSTHVAEERSVPSGLVRWIKRAIANGYRNHCLGTRFRPSSALGAMLGVLLPGAAMQLRAEGRGLELLRGGNRRVLDVGCGSGGFLALARQMGWDCFGVEMDSVAADVARQQGARILAERAEQLDGAYDGFFDAVTLSHVIEHVYDPVRTLLGCVRVLRPGGHLWIETPNIDSIGYNRYGRFWRGFDTPRHLTLFNHESLQLALQRAGLVNIRVLPARDVTHWIFTQSAAMQNGVLVGLEAQSLPPEQEQRVLREVDDANRKLRRSPEMSEFITVAANRPIC
jgi:2-polyprenyl-3-methyl-5-hydroxy-6-metoxy-1,4-benzoquinol methylase